MSFPRSLRPPKVIAQVKLVLEFNLKGKERPRFSANTGTCYMTSSYELNKQTVTLVIRYALANAPRFLDPGSMYTVDCTLYRKRRKPLSKSDAEDLDRECPYGGVCPGKPDVDNALGTVMDAANSVIYEDDSQVVDSHVVRRWAKNTGAVIVFKKLGKYG